MAYTPTTWVTGDTITTTKLNKIEQGIANSGATLICNITSGGELDKTVQEIYDAFIAGVKVYIKFEDGVLGASGTGTYASNVYYAPVIKIYGYNYDDIIRICAINAAGINDVNQKAYVFSPSVLIFSASGTSAYPEFYTTIYIPNQYAADGTMG